MFIGLGSHNKSKIVTLKNYESNTIGFLGYLTGNPERPDDVIVVSLFNLLSLNLLFSV